MLDLKEIRKLLADRRIDIVSEATGLGYTTVREVRCGVQDNPSYKTVKALSDYLISTRNS